MNLQYINLGTYLFNSLSQQDYLMKSCGMRVALLGKTLEVPNTLPPNPESVPELMSLKELLEEEFFTYFDLKIKITNWEYIMNRASAHLV